MWDNLHTKSPINDYWLKFAQLPYLPEMEMNHNDSTFIERTMQHLSKESSSRYVTDTNGYHIKNKLDAYKYVFSRKSDWSGPLNYYRNLPFYTVRSDESVRCPCLIVIGRHLQFALFNHFSLDPIKEFIFSVCIYLFFSNFRAGSEDNFCRLDAVVRSTEYCDNYIVKIIENAGHWPHQEMPTEFNRVILKFLVGLYLS